MKKNKYSWRDLIGEPQLCEGGRLASIVFCCDPRRKRCPILEEALRMLGLTVEDFVRVMEKHGIPVPEKDGTCFGNLAFCPSLEKPSKDRDVFLIRKGWSLSKYLKYKFRILLDLVPSDKLGYAFSTRVLRQYAVEMLDLETKKVYRALALGNIRSGTLMITEVFREQDLRDRQVEILLSQMEFVGVRIPKDLVEQLDELVGKGIVESRSDGIRRALMLYLSALKNHVKREARVKP